MHHWLLDSLSPDLPPRACDGIPTALLYGYSVYTTFRLPLSEAWLDRHLERLQENAQQLGLSFRWTPAELKAILVTLPLVETVVRLTVFPEIESFQALVQEGEPLPSVLLISSRALPDVGPQGALRLRSLVYERPLPQVKHGSLAGDFVARRHVGQQGATEVLWVNHQRQITEASTANIFFLKQQTLYTPDPQRDGCLPGITRRQVLEAAKSLGLPLSSAPLSVTDLPQLEGAFLSNAVLGLRLIQTIDGVAFPWPSLASQTFQRLAQAVQASCTGDDGAVG